MWGDKEFLVVAYKKYIVMTFFQISYDSLPFKMIISQSSQNFIN